MSATNVPIIRNEKVARTFQSRLGSEVVAIKDVTFDVQECEFVAIVGPSGCGKSTLLKIIAGLAPHNSGDVLVKGKPVVGPSRSIGMIFQNPILLPWKTVEDNVLLPVEVMGLPVKNYRTRVKDLIQLVGLQGFERSYPHELSGGMAQRAAIIRALLPEPEILLADEPFGALDAMTREQMNIEFQRIWLESRKTILFVTHSIPEAVFLADTVIVLSARPARVVDIVKVDFDRPRRIEMMGTNQFGDYVNRVRARFSQNSVQSTPADGRSESQLSASSRVREF